MADATLVGLEIFSKLLEERAREREGEKQRGLQMLSMQAEERQNLVRTYQQEESQINTLTDKLAEMQKEFATLTGASPESKTALDRIQAAVQQKYPDLKTDAPNLVGTVKKNMASEIYDLNNAIVQRQQKKSALRDQILDLSDEPLWSTQSALQQQQLEESKATTALRISQKKDASNEDRKLRRYERMELITALKEQIKGYDTTLLKYKNRRGGYDLTNPEAIQAMNDKNNAIEQLNPLIADLYKEIGIEEPKLTRKPVPLKDYKIGQ